MKKQTIDKIKFFFDAILLRLDDNFEFFSKVEFVYKSGVKQFVGSVLPSDDDFIFRFNGTSKTIKKSDISKEILAEGLSYEKIVVTYFERGAEIEIEGSDRGVSQHRRSSDFKKDSGAQANVIDQGKRDYIIKIGEADKLLIEIGILTKDGKLKNDMIRKYNQTDHFIELAKPVIEKLPKDRRVTVLDCACGKSYLSFVLNYYMRDILKMNCGFIGVDYNEGVIKESERIAKNLGYGNMKFICADMNSYQPDEKIDLMVSLHACDTATDMALGVGIRNKVDAIICVPCCHKEMLSQYNYEPFKPLCDFPIFKARLADTLTDAMRALYLKAKGYDVVAMEYISPLETPKNLMIKATKRGGENRQAAEEYRALSKSLGVSLSIEMYSEIQDIQDEN